MQYAILLLLFVATSSHAIPTLPLPPKYATDPFDTDVIGNGAANFSGLFRQDGGPQQFRYFIGTNVTPGSLILDFSQPFTDGAGADFALVTNSESWGVEADTALFEFFSAGVLQASFSASLLPDQVFEFDLPGTGLVADRVVVTNTTPDPPGTNNLATMTFDAAGVAYPTGLPVSEPSTLGLAGLSLLGLVFARRRTAPTKRQKR